MIARVVIFFSSRLFEMGTPRDLVEESADELCASRSIQDPNLIHWSACMRELSLHILDAVENSVKAGATRVELVIEEDLAADRLNITIRDNGRGMSEEQVAHIFDPFFTTRKTRHVGLGIPLFKAAAERCNGDLTIASELGEGTVLDATFQHSHIDRAPLGDIVTTLLTIILFDSGDLHYVHRVDERTFEFDTADIRAELGEIPLTHPEVCQWLQAFIAEGEREIGSS
jgi:signal transduction histidine kinase